MNLADVLKVAVKKQNLSLGDGTSHKRQGEGDHARSISFPHPTSSFRLMPAVDHHIVRTNLFQDLRY